MRSRSQSRRTEVPSHRGSARHLARRAGAPDPSDLAAVRRWVQHAKGPRAVDLFCGAGGLSLGLRDAGFTVLAGADADRWAVETHTANLGGLGYVGDLSDPSDLLEHLDGWGIDHVDLVAGGVPCQPFSRAGQSKIRELIRDGERHPDDPRATLWRSFMQVVERLRPEAVIVENVPDLPTWDDGVVLSGFLESFDDLGYTVDARILNLFRFGVPQHRSRLLLAAFRDGRQMHWPVETDEMVTLRDAIGDLPPVPGGVRVERLPYRQRPNSASAFVNRMRQDVPQEERGWITDHMTRSVRDDDWQAYDGLAQGQTYADMPAHLQRYRTDIFTDKYKRLAWHELSRTITAHIAKDGYWYIHPEQHRTLSIREAARLQTFPDWFCFAGQPSHRYAQIGNAVPPIAGEAIGSGVLQAMAGLVESSDSRHTPRESLIEWNRTQPTHPWRRPSMDSWLVLAGELSLDRTSPDDLGARFAAMCALAPDPGALLELESPVTALGEAGLSPHGARLLTGAAESILELFDGSVPKQDLELRMIPGVGDSVAKAVLCFGQGRSVVPLHTAASRVATRMAGAEHRRRWQLRLDLHRLARPVGPDASFNAAVLELGATVCHAVDPICPACPVREHCASNSAAHAEPMLAEVAA